MPNKIQDLLKQLSLKTLMLILLLISCLCVFAYIATENVVEKEDQFDIDAIAWTAAHSTPLLIHVMQVITFFGSLMFLLPAYLLLVIYFWWRKKKLYAASIAIIAISSTALMYLFKQIFRRHRPLLPAGKGLLTYSFPSGHSVSSFIFSCVLACLVWQLKLRKGWKYTAAFFLLLFTLSIGLSRVVLNVHYATDVIAGFCLGIIWVIISFWVLQTIPKKNPAAMSDSGK